MRPFRAFKHCIYALFLGIMLIACLGDTAIAGTAQLYDLQISGAGHQPVAFQVEVMQTPDQRSKGLMGREHLPSTQGMLFDFKKPVIVHMWMHNTLIPLDMLFIDAQGVIRYIHKQAQPMSKDIITSPVEIRWVLEINGGLSDILKIAPEDRITSKEIDIFEKSL